MRVGYGATFQNPGRELTDREVYREEIRLARLAEPLRCAPTCSSS